MRAKRTIKELKVGKLYSCLEPQSKYFSIHSEPNWVSEIVGTLILSSAKKFLIMILSDRIAGSDDSCDHYVRILTPDGLVGWIGDYQPYSFLWLEETLAPSPHEPSK